MVCEGYTLAEVTCFQRSLDDVDKERGKMLDSIDKERCPKSGEFVRIYLEAGFVPAFVDLEVDI